MPIRSRRLERHLPNSGCIPPFPGPPAATTMTQGQLSIMHIAYLFLPVPCHWEKPPIPKIGPLPHPFTNVGITPSKIPPKTSETPMMRKPPTKKQKMPTTPTKFWQGGWEKNLSVWSVSSN